MTAVRAKRGMPADSCAPAIEVDAFRVIPTRSSAIFHTRLAGLSSFPVAFALESAEWAIKPENPIFESASDLSFFRQDAQKVAALRNSI